MSRAARSRRATPMAGDDAWLPRWSAAAQQGTALSRRPAQGGRDHHRHARRRRRLPRPPAPRLDRRPVANRAAHPRRARPRRTRSRSAPRRPACPARQRRPAPGGRHGHPGAGKSSSPGSSRACSCPSGHCSASSTGLAVGPAAAAHDPGTDGGPADRGCRPVQAGATYVGATRVSCRIARKVAAGVKRGQRFTRWRCTWSGGRAFGHCHGRGIRRGGIVHWAVND